MKDLYYILGTHAHASPGELTGAYRKLAQKLQSPGQESDEFIDRHFEDITEAYQTLSNPAQRKKYDAAFKKYQQRKLYFFKLRYLNIAVTLTLIAFTTVFGYYVLQSLSGSKSKKVVAVIQPPAPIVKHAKKRRKPKAIVHHPENKKTSVKVAAETEAPVEEIAVTPVATAKSTPVTPTKKWVHTETTPPVVNGYTPPVEEKAAAPVVKATTTNNTATLEGNVTGLIYLHQTPSLRSAVLANIPSHATVSVLEKNQSFYKVSYNNLVGYVPKWTVHEQ